MQNVTTTQILIRGKFSLIVLNVGQHTKNESLLLVVPLQIVIVVIYNLSNAAGLRFTRRVSIPYLVRELSLFPGLPISFRRSATARFVTLLPSDLKLLPSLIMECLWTAYSSS